MREKKIKRMARAVLFVLLVTAHLAGCSPIGIEALESGEMDVSIQIDAEQVKEKAGEAGEKVKEGAEWAVREGEELGDAVTTGISQAWLTACLYFRGWAPFVIVGSLLTGYALVEVFPKNAEIRKFAVVTMCVRVPSLTLLVTYAALISYKWVAGRKAVLAERAAKTAVVCAAWYEIAAPFGWAAAALCIVSIILGLVLTEKFRKNPDVVKMATRYLMVRIPMILFLVFMLYPFLYVMLS